MKILHLSSEYPPQQVFGLGRFVYDLAGESAQQGHEVVVVTNSMSGKQFELVERGVRVHRVHFPPPPKPTDNTTTVVQFNLQLLERLIPLLYHWRPDVVNSHDWLTFLAAHSIERAWGVPHVFTVHDTMIGKNFGQLDNPQRLAAHLEKFGSQQAQTVICCSEYVKKELVQTYDAKSSIAVIPCAVNESSFAVDEQAILLKGFRSVLAREDEVLVTYVGRLDKEKGLEVLLYAIGSLLSKFTQVKFVLAGKGQMRKSLESWINQNKLSDKIQLLGYVKGEMLSYLYKVSDIQVVPSTYEPFGIVALEGMINRVAVVVADSGGLAEIVSHGKDGLQFRSGDGVSLASRLEELLQKPAWRKQLAQAGYHRAREFYNWQRITQKTVAVYQSLLGEGESQEPEVVGLEQEQPPQLEQPVAVKTLERRIRVAIDVRVVEPHMRGIGIYVQQLVYHLAELDEVELLLLGNSQSQKIFQQCCPKVAHLTIHAPLGDPAWEEKYIAEFAKGCPIDVYHGPSFTTAISGDFAKVVTVHDLCFVRFPRFYDLRFAQAMEKRVEQAVESADLVLVNSSSTRKELLHYWQSSAPEVVTTHLGVGAEFFDRPSSLEIETLRSKYQVADKFVILALGMGQERKNARGIWQALAALDETIRKQCVVVMIAQGWAVNQLAEREAAKWGIEEQIRITGEVSAQELWQLYHLADVLCYPSWHEGFGLPILEAFAAGTPVITSSTGAMPEIASEAALLVTSGDRQQLAAALRRLFDDSQLRQELIVKGKERAKEFSWQQTAAKTLQAYYRAMENFSQHQSEAVASLSPACQSARPPLRIGIDARLYGQIHLGTGRYTTELIQALLAHGLDHLVLFGGEHSVSKLCSPRVTWVPGPALSLLDERWQQQWLCEAIEEQNIDVYLAPTGIVPQESSIASIAVIHDLGFEHHPEFYDSSLLPYLKKWLAHSCAQASALVSVSQFTRHDLMETYQVAPERITTIYPGIEHVLSNRHTAFDQPQQEPYLLCISSGGDNKNVAGAVRVLGHLPGEIKKRLRLKIVGSLSAQTQLELNQIDPELQVDILGRVSEKTLQGLLAQAFGLIHLSYFEGFGLPVAEAMGLGIPVIVADQAALPEVVGESGIVVAIDEKKLTAQWIERLWMDQALWKYCQQRGKQRSQSFRWSIAASKISQLAATLVPCAADQPGLRVAFVSPWGGECGIATYTRDLLQALAEAGSHSLFVLTEEREGQAVVEENGITVIGCWKRGHSLQTLVALIKQHRIDCVNIQYHPAFYPDEVLAQLLWECKYHGIATVVTLHEIEPRHAKALFLVPERILVHNAVSREFLKKKWELGAEIAMIPIGVAPEPRVVCGNLRSQQSYRIVSVGFLQHSKGFHLVLQAVAQLHQDFPQLHYRVVGAKRPGAEQYPQELQELANQLGLAKHFEVVEGFFSEERLRQEIAQADVVVYPYTHETLGASGAITHALAVGRAIVVSNSAYFSDLGEAVMVFQDVSQLQSQLRHLLSDKESALQLGNKALELAQQRSWYQVAQQHLNFYRRSLARKKTKKRIKPWVSVHIISKEQDQLGWHFFQSCLQCLRGYPDELIVVDNGSSSEVIAMVQQELEHFNSKLIFRPELSNYRDLRNAALDATHPQATHIHWVDTDEIFFPHDLPKLRLAMEDGDIALFHTLLVHFMIDPGQVEGLQPKKNVFRYAPGMRWSKSVHEVIEGLPPGRQSFIPIEHLHFGYCRPQWQTFIKWIRYALLEYGNVECYRYEQVNGQCLPWFRQGRTPDTILNERIPRLHPYKGDYPEPCREWLAPWWQEKSSWKEYLHRLTDHSLWYWWQARHHLLGNWQETIDEVIQRMGWKETG